MSTVDEQRSELVALRRIEERLRDGEAAVVERRAERVPVEGVDAARERGGGGRHGRRTRGAPRM
jgi:hypothetical protein